MQTILIVLQVFLSLGLIGLVLIQHGKGADAGAAFGSGASQTVFGSQGSGSFLTRLTAIIATLFFLTSMALAYFATQGEAPAGLMDGADGTAIIDVAPVPVEPEPVSRSDIPSMPGVSVAGPGATGSDVPPVTGSTAVSVEGDVGPKSGSGDVSVPSDMPPVLQESSQPDPIPSGEVSTKQGAAESGLTPENIDQEQVERASPALNASPANEVEVK